jgi:hypothetical protein
MDDPEAVARLGRTIDRYRNSIREDLALEDQPLTRFYLPKEILDIRPPTHDSELDRDC